jgi:hypothetical protein
VGHAGRRELRLEDAHAARVGADGRGGAGPTCDRSGPEFDAAETTEIAGPREERLVEAARLLAARRGEGLRVEEQSDPSGLLLSDVSGRYV